MERDIRKNTSPFWDYFIKKGEDVATCKACQNDFSYKGSVSNLRKHWLRKHSNNEKMRGGIETSDSEQEVSTDKPGATWKFFSILDSDKFSAHCKLCEQEIAYDSVSDLSSHIKEHHGMATKDSDDEDDRSIKKKRSVAWQFFKCVDSRRKIASCLICKSELSFYSSVSNLMKHIKRRHSDYKILDGDDDNENSKTVMISADGDLYEIESLKQRNGETDEERDPIEMDTVYLEDLESPTNEIKPKKRILMTKPKIKNSSVKRLKSNKEQISNIRSRNIRLSNNRYSNSSDEEVIEEVIKKPKKDRHTDTIDIFGKYVVSLLKDLPKQVSEQLQGEIIKQIMSTKVALQATAAFTANSELNENLVTNQVTVTISNTDTDTQVVNGDDNRNETDT